DREAHIACSPNESERVDVLLIVVAVSRVPTGGLGYEADRLVVTDHPRRDSGALRGLADIHRDFSYAADGRQRRNVRAFATTLTLEKAIAAPATTGLR